ncbi:MAG: hypothetical protein U0X75_26030 [Acidobacteriota bacterium]
MDDSTNRKSRFRAGHLHGHVLPPVQWRRRTRKGLGVRHEGGAISAELYNRQTETAKFIPNVFSVADFAHIPTLLRTNRHQVDVERLESDKNFENLYRHLTNQPRAIPKQLGKMRSLPPINRQEEFDEDSKEVSGPSNTQQQRIVRLVNTTAQS